MLLQLKNSTEQFHAPSGIGRALILAGVVEEVLTPAQLNQALKAAGLPALLAPTKWSASVVGDGLYAPVVKFTCPNCSKSGHQESERGTAHQTARFFHCGKTETCPREVAETYLA